MTDNKTKSPLSRRNFLGIVWAGSLTLIFAQAVVVMLRFIKPVATEGFGGLVYAGRLEEFAVNSVNRIASGRFYITRTPDGIIALWQKCPHLGCAVPWDEQKGVFHCPCHGSTFNQYGQVLSGPAPRAMDYFLVEVDEEGVWVDTSTPIDRVYHDPSHLTDV